MGSTPTLRIEGRWSSGRARGSNPRGEGSIPSRPVSRGWRNWRRGRLRTCWGFVPVAGSNPAPRIGWEKRVGGRAAIAPGCKPGVLTDFGGSSPSLPITGCSSVWSERPPRTREASGSTPLTLIERGVAQPGQSACFGSRKSAGSNPVAPISQGVAQSGLECLLWKQEGGGSTPPTLITECSSVW